MITDIYNVHLDLYVSIVHLVCGCHCTLDTAGTVKSTFTVPVKRKSA